jgi:Fe-S cluster assembly iron-binding protein IscA
MEGTVPMLQCTPAAAATLDQVREEQGLPDSVGLRVFPAQDPSGQITLGLGFTDEPHEGDQVAEQHGTRLFVAPEVADQLADMALDIEGDPSSNGAGSAQLVLRPSTDA